MKVLSVLLIAVLLATGGAKADNAVYPAYTYDEWNTSKITPQNYLPEKVLTGESLASGAFKNPQDICVGTDGKLYVADTGNDRILVFDSDMNLLDTITSVNDGSQEIAIDHPTGLYAARDGKLYVAQQTAMNALVLDETHRNVLLKLENPKHELIEEDFVFRPSKIAADRAGRIYVLSYGCYMGFMQFDPQGNFMGYYGSNKVEVTAQILFNYFWKQLMSDEQRESMISTLPIEYANLCYAPDGFIYAATVGTTYTVNQIKKLNPLGNNTYYGENREEINFGDAEIANVSVSGGVRAVTSTFVDVIVDDEGFVFGLDRELGRIFERDPEGNLIGVFGGIGDQIGTFKAPCAIELWQGKTLILDSNMNTITVFKPTDYEVLIHEAVTKYNGGHYDEALELWRKVLRYNANSTLAYLGIGRALMKAGKVEESLYYFKMGFGRYEYSQAYRLVRLERIRKYAGTVVIVLAALILLLWIWKRYRRRHPRKEGMTLYGRVRLAVLRFLHLKSDTAYPRVLLHPFEGFGRIRFEGADALWLTVLLLLLSVSAFVYQYRDTGFVFNYNKAEEMNFLLIVAKSVGIFAAFCAANWSMSILTNGIGRLKDIVISTAYAASPYIFAVIISTFLSNYLTLNEPFAVYIVAAGIIWSVILLLIATMVIHEYTFFRSVLFLLLCIVAMAIMVFVLVLFYTLLQQLYSFVFTIVIEAIFRF